MKCYSSVEPAKTYSGLSDLDIDNLAVLPERCPPTSATSSPPPAPEVSGKRINKYTIRLFLVPYLLFLSWRRGGPSPCSHPAVVRPG